MRRSEIAKSNTRRLGTGSDEYCRLGFVRLHPCDETKGGPSIYDSSFRAAGSARGADLKGACWRWCRGLDLRVDAYSPSLSYERRESFAGVALECRYRLPSVEM